MNEQQTFVATFSNVLETLVTSSHIDNILAIGLSIGKPQFEGARLNAIVQAVINFNKKHPKKNQQISGVVFILADTLKRYDWEIFGADVLTAYLEAKREGNVWKTRNASCYSQLKSVLTIREWDENIFNEKTIAALNALYQFYGQPLLDTCTETIATFLENLSIENLRDNKAEIDPQKAKIDPQQANNYVASLKIDHLPSQKIIKELILKIILQSKKLDWSKNTIQALLLMAIDYTNNNKQEELSNILDCLATFQKEDKAKTYNHQYFKHYEKINSKWEEETEPGTLHDNVELAKSAISSNETINKNRKIPLREAEAKTRAYIIEELADFLTIAQQYSGKNLFHAYPITQGGKATQYVNNAFNLLIQLFKLNNIYPINIEIVESTKERKLKRLKKQQGFQDKFIGTSLTNRRSSDELPEMSVPEDFEVVEDNKSSSTGSLPDLPVKQNANDIPQSESFSTKSLEPESSKEDESRLSPKKNKSKILPDPQGKGELHNNDSKQTTKSTTSISINKNRSALFTQPTAQKSELGPSKKPGLSSSPKKSDAILALSNNLIFVAKNREMKEEERLLIIGNGIDLMGEIIHMKKKSVSSENNLSDSTTSTNSNNSDSSDKDSKFETPDELGHQLN